MQRRSRDRNVRAFEFVMRNERKIREAVKEVRLCKKGYTGGAPTGHAHIADPTAGEAIRRAEELAFVEIEGGGRVEWPERWLRVIDAVRAWCEPIPIRREILRRRYSGESWVKTCAEIKTAEGRHLSESKYHRIVMGICNYAVKCAIQVRIIKIF